MAASKGDYTDKAMVDHAKTYSLFLSLLKAGIVVVILALIILMIVYAV